MSKPLSPEPLELTGPDLREVVAEFGRFYKWILRVGVVLVALGIVFIVGSPWMPAITVGGAVHGLAPLVVWFPLAWLLNRLAINVASMRPIGDIVPIAFWRIGGFVMVAGSFLGVASVFLGRDSHSSAMVWFTGTALLVLGVVLIKWTVAFRRVAAQTGARHGDAM